MVRGSSCFTLTTVIAEICIQEAVKILQDPIWLEYMEPSKWFKACRGDAGARDSLIGLSKSWFSVAEKCDEKVVRWAAYSNGLYCYAIKYNREEKRLGRREGEFLVDWHFQVATERVAMVSHDSSEEDRLHDRWIPGMGSGDCKTVNCGRANSDDGGGAANPFRRKVHGVGKRVCSKWNLMSAIEDFDEHLGDKQ